MQPSNTVSIAFNCTISSLQPPRLDFRGLGSTSSSLQIKCHQFGRPNAKRLFIRLHFNMSFCFVFLKVGWSFMTGQLLHVCPVSSWPFFLGWAWQSQKNVLKYWKQWHICQTPETRISQKMFVQGISFWKTCEISCLNPQHLSCILVQV